MAALPESQDPHLSLNVSTFCRNIKEACRFGGIKASIQVTYCFEKSGEEYVFNHEGGTQHDATGKTHPRARTRPRFPPRRARAAVRQRALYGHDPPPYP